ncbi:TlpA family protein disulfide reductase [Subsaximicrobium wynnwilliamsii]|uniref:TlpA family protein disulfide reductase n=1 Tax=Subsaximicrobium wynnwilliamsii TaxID=291179 RepID=A0A5C6ZQE3_9FLAO|nr:TlpA disulfide reductase family protein [Subsaximicrobium wynnwilliamsii]TXD85100.1 TlpA family protein disulfide reductase [Subsaximicrobium wynnwilliamsii]TXD91143.1 TlpA family protein disulfide reductase [Subsaximicrobium wynnwilliamsii]TXE04537.1 TlpA family protein disulfide reductase [Subsaximicrobium wynnwilliamsii]
MLKALVYISVLIFLISCKSKPSQSLEAGLWRAELQLTNDEALPFNFEVTAAETLTIFNAEEQIEVHDIGYSGDTVRIQMPVFEGYIEAIHSSNRLKGSFVIESLDRRVPFSAEFGKEFRFESTSKESLENVSGTWEALFSPNLEADRYLAKGVFKQDGSKVTGTFETTTGDYRYLEGVMDGDVMKLSTFDGAHAFLFTAKVTDSTMNGKFYSGNHWEEPFTAKRNPSYELPDANALTFLKDGYERLEFSFPDASGKIIALSDERFKGKVTVVQLMGTWCPNCLDESRFYAEYDNANLTKDMEFVALAFEYAKTEAEAFESITRLKNEVGINYPILLAQYGSSSKLQAEEKLPMLNHVLSYPTTIFIDKKGKVRKIHTGFNGPATGEKYSDFKVEFDDFINELLAEEAE